ncbi:MAG: hypothetical protein KDC98_21680 [Planctomycetes bacterium]|nr:hypothetical protein [Planctomycetota bacterium]
MTALTFPADPKGDVPLQITLVDAESDAVDLVLEFSLGSGASWRPAHVVAGQVTSDLAATPGGTVATILWDSLRDLGFRPVSARLRARPLTADGRDGSAAIATVPPLANLRVKAARVQRQMIHYGAVDAATAALCKQHDLVVLHPLAAQLLPAVVRDIQLGVDAADPADDVLVLAYISVGEDLRTVSLTDAEMLLDPRFTGDGSGPRVDPRGPDADGDSLLGIDPLGAPTNAAVGTRYASFYLDDNSIDRSPSNVGDGLPDRNGNFGGCFVNAGDPAWYAALDAMTFDGADGQPGMRELLRTDYGRGYGCDGLFLDTIDTCAPNAYTDASSSNQSEFEWTAPGFAAFMARLHQDYPDHLVLQNRGMFLFDPRLPHFQATTRASIDFVLIESYRLDSSQSQQFDSYFFADNKHNLGPKVLAEAGRPDGFRVLSLGYAEGPGIDAQTLLGTSSTGLQTLLDDIAEAQYEAGFAHYLTDAGLQLANTFVRDHLDADTSPPVWSSTYNDNPQSYPTPPGAPTPRVGIQRVTAGVGSATIYWDIAKDPTGVGYALYSQSTPFDFVADPLLHGARRTVLVPELGGGYSAGVGPGIYPYQATVTGLDNGTTWYFCLRAFDRLGHEDSNTAVQSAVPMAVAPIVIDGAFADWATVPVLHVDPADAGSSSGPDWREISITSDASNVYIRFTSEHAFNLDGSPGFGFSRTFVFLDLDENPATGWPIGAVGSELMLSGAELFTQSSSVFNTGSLGTTPVLPVTGIVECELAIPWSRIDAVQPGASRLRLLFVNDEVSDYAPDTGYLSFEAVR